MTLAGNKPYTDVPEDVYPVHVKQSTGRTVLIVQAAAFTRFFILLTKIIFLLFLI